MDLANEKEKNRAKIISHDLKLLDLDDRQKLLL